MAAGYSNSASQLLFQVKGAGTQPTEKEGLIWCKTSIPITAWVISANDPAAGAMINSAGSNLGTLNSRTYTKTNDGWAAWAWVKTPAYCGPMLVSTNQAAAGYSWNSSAEAADQTIRYNCKTYYYGTGAWHAVSASSDINSKTPLITADCFADAALILAKTYEVCLGNGGIWIQSGTSNGINVIKKNDIEVFPSGCMQFIDGRWKKIEAFLYKNGRWVQFSSSRYYIYSAANSVNIGLTYYQYGGASCSVNASRIAVSTSDSISPYVVFSTSKTGTGKYTKLVAVCTTSKATTSTFGFSSTKPTSYNAGVTFVSSKSLANGTNTLDISNITSDYYFCIKGGGVNGISFTVTEIWLE